MDSFIKNILREALNDAGYLKWKRANVTFRGMKEIGVSNADTGAYHGEVLGQGLYSAALSNKSMAKGYGTLYFAVNAKPKTPKVFNNTNEWEIWFYRVLVGEKYNRNGFPDKREFNKHTTIRDEMLKLGFDGIIIKGREMVNYTPENVMYFRTEDELKNYYAHSVA